MSPLPAGQIPIGGFIRSTYIDDQGNIGAVLDYDEVTDVPTFTIDGDVLLITKVPGQPMTTLRFVGEVQRPHQVLGIAVGTDRVFTDSDFGSLDTHPEDAVTVPTFTGTDKYLAIWYPADGLEINVVQLVGSRHNHVAEFGNPVALTVGVQAGYYIVTTNTIAAARSGAKLLAYNTTGLSTYTRYGALRAMADGNTFTAADFTGANGFSSTTGAVKDPRTAPDRGLLSYWAVAVPVAQADVTGLVRPGFFGMGYTGADLIRQFERQAGTVSIGGVDYKVWRSTGTYNDIAPLDMLIVQNPVL